MNDPWRLPPLTTNSTAPQATATVQKATRNQARSANRWRVSMNAAAPSARTAKSDSLPAAVTAPAEFGIALTDDEHARTPPIAPSSQGEGTLRRSQSSRTASTAVTSSAGSAGPIETRRAADADVHARQVGCPKQAEAEGDEEDVERKFRHRQPRRAWRLAGHRESL